MREKRMFDDSMRYASHGTLPVDGGFLDQDPRFCEALGIVEDVLTTLRSQQHAAE